MNGTVEGLVESERLVRMLRALQCDCENTDGWEAAALDIQEAINTILSLQSQLVASREALERARDAIASLDEDALGGTRARGHNSCDAPRS